MSPITAAQKRVGRQRAVVHFIAWLIANFSWILYVVGLGWLLAFSTAKFDKEGRFDENAILAGQVNRYFNDEDASVGLALVDSIRMEAANGSGVSRAAFIEKTLTGFGLDASIHSFSIPPMSINEGRSAYGIARAPRADGTEALVFVAPWKCADGKDNVYGIANLISFAKFEQRWSHWAKDMIFLFPDHGPTGVHAWLEAYHGEEGNSGVISYEPLTYHGGVLQQAISVELCGEQDYSALGMHIEGLNGQQANADMVVLAVWTGKFEGLKVMLHESTPSVVNSDEWAGVSPNPPPRTWVTDHLDYILRLWEYIRRQALGLPTGCHAFFPRYRVEALTLKGVLESNSYYNFGPTKFGMYLESYTRALNNLLERLHHAYWFYLMSSAERFIPLAVYIPPVILLSISLAFQSLGLWWKSGREVVRTPGISKVVPGTKFLARPPEVSTFTASPRRIGGPLFVLGACFAASFLHFNAPAMLWSVAHTFTPNLDQSWVQFLCQPRTLLLWLASQLATQTLLPSFLVNFLQKRGEYDHQSALVLKALIVGTLAMFLLTVSALNPSISIVLAVPLVPLFAILWPSKYSLLRAIQQALLQSASPLSVALLLAWTSTGGLPALMEWVRIGVEGWVVYGAFVLPFAALVWSPLVTAGLVLVNMKV